MAPVNPRRSPRPARGPQAWRPRPHTPRADRDRTAWLALAVALLSLVVSMGQYYLTYRQAERIAEQAGPVLDVTSALQLRSSDGRTQRRVTEEQHPIVRPDTLATHSAVDLVLTVTNIGRDDTAVLGAELTMPAAPDEPSTRTTSGIPAARCSNVGGIEVDCASVLPYRLPPGGRYYLTFPLQPARDRLALLGPGAVLIDIDATGVPDGHRIVPSGVTVDLREPPRSTRTPSVDPTPTSATPDRPTASLPATASLPDDEYS
jgi:hypothetical protein